MARRRREVKSEEEKAKNFYEKNVDQEGFEVRYLAEKGMRDKLVEVSNTSFKRCPIQSFSHESDFGSNKNVRVTNKKLLLSVSMVLRLDQSVMRIVNECF